MQLLCLAVSEARACEGDVDGFHGHSSRGNLETRHATAGSDCSPVRSICDWGLQVTRGQVDAGSVRKDRVS